MDNFHTMVQTKLAGGPDLVPNWVIVGTFVIMMLFVYSQIAISYTHGSVVATLAMVEQPTTRRSGIVDAENPPPYADDPDAKLPPYETEPMLTPTSAITESNRGTVRHLKRVGGRGARFRGVGVALLHGALSHVICNLFFMLFGRGQQGMALGFILSQVVLFRVNMLWTHIVISKPSTLRFYQRIVPRRLAGKVVLPTLAWACVHVAIPAILVALIDFMGLERDLHRPADKWCVRMALFTASKLLGLFMAGAGLLLGLYVPVNVALTRCQTSLLAEHEEPIVPIDVALTNLATPEAPRLRMKDAWRSFDWNARARLAKVYLRTLGYQIISIVFFTTVGILFASAWVMLN